MKKILLIEDNINMREVIAEILELAQYQVFISMNGRTGSLMAKEIIPDLIICDITMPDIDGYEVLSLLSKDPETASIPFIFISGKSEKSEIRKGMDLGADDYLTKPFDSTELLKTIRIRLKKSELIKDSFFRNFDGLNKFIDKVGGLNELHNLSMLKPASSYKKKEVIFHEGDTPHYLYFLVKGKIKTYKTHNDGKEYITNILTDGDFFGHVSLIDNKPYTESSLVLEKSDICKIPREDFLALFYKNREVSKQFIKMLSNQIEGQETQLLRLAYDSVRTRTAEALLYLQKNITPSDVNANRIMVSRDDLAKIVGTSTESVIRCLCGFKEDNLIDISGRGIAILNKNALKNIQ